jgi:hypothetical protein
MGRRHLRRESLIGIESRSEECRDSGKWTRLRRSVLTHQEGEVSRVGENGEAGFGRQLRQDVATDRRADSPEIRKASRSRAFLTRRRRASTWMCEQLDLTDNTRPDEE